MSDPGHVLVVDDEESIRESLGMILGGAGHRVTAVGSGEEGLTAAAADRPDLVFLDLQLPGIDGLETLRKLRENDGTLRIVMISGHATIERAVEATRLGAFDFLEKPFGRDKVLVLARNAMEAAGLEKEVARLQAGEAGEILGKSSTLDQLRSEIESVAGTDARVLILGESGTGKELVAAALHSNSTRAKGPFIRVNCAAIPEDLIEAELFGSAKGAFTGAVKDRRGRFGAADKGTLFLDEIGDMSLQAQAKVLRVLQEGQYEPVGSTETVSVDVRVIAATHRDLAESVAHGTFREDLLFRLNVIPIQVPALRERRGDPRILGEHFIDAYARKYEKAPPRLTEEAWAALEDYAWPGNVRELKNLMERWVILKSGKDLGPRDLGIDLSPGTTGDGGDLARAYSKMTLKDAREAIERDLIRAALEENEGNVTRAAEQLGLERTHLHKRIRALGVKES